MENSGLKSDLIRLITKSSDDYDRKYMKIKFNSHDELPLNKTIEILTMTIVVRAIFLENNIISKSLLNMVSFFKHIVPEIYCLNFWEHQCNDRS